MGTAPRDWLAPRYSAEIAWARLSWDLSRAARELTEPSWFNAIEPLRRTLALYDASRTYALPDPGLEFLVTPQIEGAFLRHEGLRHHLDDYLRRMEVSASTAP